MRPFIQGESFFNIIKRAIPDFVESEYPVFVTYVETFLKFLEQQRTFVDQTVYPEYGTTPNSIIQATQTLGGPFYETRKLLEYRDVDSSLAEFKTHFLAMFGKNFPTYQYIPADLFIRSLREFYQNKGTVESFQWLFRVLFNEEAEVYFPRKDVLRASDGTWLAPISIKVSSPKFGKLNADVATFYVGQRIQTATGSAQVETIVTTVVGQSYGQNIVVNELRLKFDSILGVFLPGQDLFNIDSTEVIHTTILPVISGITVNSGGSNYSVGDVVTFSEGPGGGGGFGAFGIVEVISNTAINGININDGGNGYLIGEPITFVSVSGHGASAVVSNVIFGNLELEDGSGYFLEEDNTTRFQLEDQNMLLLELVIDPFVNATATVTIDSTDYGLDTGVVSMLGVEIDSEISYALAALDEKPFMHPWVFTDTAETVAELANALANVAFTSNTFFDNTAVVFALSGPQDVSTNVINANVKATVIRAFVEEGGKVGSLYLKNFTGLNLFTTGQILKQAGNGVMQVGTVTTENGSANIVGTNTVFTSVLVANDHVRFDDGSQATVRSVVNNTFFVTFAPITSNLVANSYSIVPTGNVTAVTTQSQRYYGKIKAITMLTNGVHYEHPPALFVDSVSARAQEFFHLDPHPWPPVDITSANNEIVPSAHQISVFDNAVLTANQSAGQIQAVKLLDSGVNYQDANAIVVTATHTPPATGANAELTALTGALTHAPGHYTTSRGFLSADKFLQDATFYNDYTYVIRVAESFDRYHDILLKLLHPAGFHVLGTVVDILSAELTVPQAVMVLRERHPLPITLLISDALWGNGVSMPRTVGSLESYYDGDHDIP
jgi:hypothetical protein